MSKVLLLIVEDEALIAATLESALNDADYECIVADNGQEALNLLNQDAARFQGVLTDIRLGQGPDGWEVGQRARERVHDMPIIYMSGDSGADWSSKGVPNSLMIQKPYALAQVVTAISQLITTVATARAGSPAPPSPR
jgi:DNA-binding response OmpR family regulator